MTATLIEGLANSRAFARLRRALLSRLPFLRLQSDVADVVYLTWLVPIENARHLAPPSVTLWQRGGLTPFSILTYRHRHFGPACAGPLRRMFGSPRQSNWRLYLSEAPAPAPPGRTVLFTHNMLSHALYALGARMMSDALPSELPAKFVHECSDGLYRSELVPGSGSSPALRSLVRTVETAHLPPNFASIFPSWHEAVEFLTLQDAAVVEARDDSRLAHATIDLPIPMEEVRAAEAVEIACPVLDALGPVAGPPLCFVVPRVPFRVLSERLLPPA